MAALVGRRGTTWRNRPRRLSAGCPLAAGPRRRPLGAVWLRFRRHWQHKLRPGCMPGSRLSNHAYLQHLRTRWHHKPTHQRRQRPQPQLQLMPLRNGDNNITSSAKKNGNDSDLGSRHTHCQLGLAPALGRPGSCVKGEGESGNRTLQAALPAQRRGERHHQHLDLGLMLNNISINTTIFHMSVH